MRNEAKIQLASWKFQLMEKLKLLSAKVHIKLRDF